LLTVDLRHEAAYALYNLACAGGGDSQSSVTAATPSLRQSFVNVLALDAAAAPTADSDVFLRVLLDMTGAADADAIGIALSFVDLILHFFPAADDDVDDGCGGARRQRIVT
jgi:hypothetical protein